MVAGFADCAFGADPWIETELIKPADFAKQIEAGTAPPIVCVAFPRLYNDRHIRGAKYAGPGNTPEGIKDLEAFAATLRKDSAVVLYCGCCPLKDCPNIRPAYAVLKRMGFQTVRVVNMPNSLHNDWTEQQVSDAFTKAGLIPVHVDFSQYAITSFNDTASVGL